MPHSASTAQPGPRDGQREPTTERTLRLVVDARTSQEVQTALEAIPADSITARTAGSLRVAGPRRTIAEERAAFERGVAEENAESSER